MRCAVMNCYLDYQLMFLILDGINHNKENENLITYLIEANPYIWEGECSADSAVYENFKRKYNEYENHSDYSYDFILEYLKTIEYYKGLYEAITSITKDKYLECCKDILTNNDDLLKN